MQSDNCTKQHRTVYWQPNPAHHITLHRRRANKQKPQSRKSPKSCSLWPDFTHSYACKYLFKPRSVYPVTDKFESPLCSSREVWSFAQIYNSALCTPTSSLTVDCTFVQILSRSSLVLTEGETKLQFLQVSLEAFCKSESIPIDSRIKMP